jgi:hypothetical protein
MWRTRDLLDGLRFIRHRDCNSHAIVEAGNPARKPSLSLYRSEKEDLEYRPRRKTGQCLRVIWLIPTAAMTITSTSLVRAKLDR